MRLHLRKSEPLLPVPLNCAGFGINGNDPAAGKLRYVQDDDTITAFTVFGMNDSDIAAQYPNLRSYSL
ncbi:MAG: hypothetical protein CVV30_09845 [Methanomicrobiales archaeon HGW-Methanomicrobiales-1]|jgi:hypothetical protein|nr:MAG: hypothetical protein CVV30_09845 [Methanomicrobiales archaeon HGW-Methanomicrobiales-1]